MGDIYVILLCIYFSVLVSLLYYALEKKVEFDSRPWIYNVPIHERAGWGKSRHRSFPRDLGFYTAVESSVWYVMYYNSCGTAVINAICDPKIGLTK